MNIVGNFNLVMNPKCEDTDTFIRNVNSSDNVIPMRRKELVEN